ncbi:MAG TPA: tRNA lysidine(34) synthetase TilS [Terriglobales bacterium]|nr:tRNA lysidine(34) synthetase TilS [Terriglobales bacterium]
MVKSIYYEVVREQVLAYIREHELLKPGDRVGVAVSGGADSVAMLRVLLELRDELGVVLSVLHFNHRIRGADADEDERFVSELAEQQGLEFHRSSADVPAYATQRKLSLETAGREARYHFFQSFFQKRSLDVVATGHTLDDQAETVLMRVLRGAGTKGLGGIYPKKAVLLCGGEEVRYIVRPLLGVRRAEVRDYLGSINQRWREDATNVDLQYTRNRIRHGLIPLIETRFQPTAVTALAQLAEVAREEENYWEAELRRVMPEVTRRSATGAGLSVNIPRLVAHPPALQRRILRNCAQLLGVTLDFDHLEGLLRSARCCASEKTRACELPGGWMVVREQQEFRFELRCKSGQPGPLSYEYRLPVPGEAEILEVGRVIRAFLRPVKPGASGYNPEQSLDPAALGGDLIIRNWRAGDRLWPAHSKGPKKMKELFEERRVPAGERQSWPVAASGGKLAWARGFGVSTEFQPASDARQVVVIEEHVLHPRREW